MSQTKAQLIEGKSATIEFTGGSASTPAVSFTGDTNTGIYSPGADQVAISTGGSGRLFVDSNGRVGIGVSSPGDIAAGYGVVHVGGTNGGGVRMGTSTTPYGYVAGSATGVELGTLGSTAVSFFTNNQTRATVTSAGNVGIGTSSPDAKFQVNQAISNGASAFAVYPGVLQVYNTQGLANSDASLKFVHAFSAGDVATGEIGTAKTDYFNSSAYRMFFRTGGTERLTISSAGNVGIGTSSPAAKVDVWPASTDAAFRGNSGVSVQVPAFEFRGYNTNTTNGGLDIRTNLNGTFTDRVRITNDGLVGIGTTSPSTVLDVNTGSGNSQLRISNGTSVGFVGIDSSFVGVDYSSQSGGHRFRVGASFTEAARIDSSGRLLVGTSSTLAGATDSLLQIRGNSSGSQFAGKVALAAEVAAGSIVSGTDLGAIYFGNVANGIGGLIECKGDAQWGTNDYPGRLVFSTTADGASSPTERMRIISNGNISIGGEASPTYRLDIRVPNNTETSGSLVINNASGIGSIYMFNVSGTGVNTSNAAIWIEKNTSTNRSINAGGTINASGADYAEYMVKAGDFNIAKGAVCGITSDGLLTLNYADAVSFVVKSTNPSYVGGDTWGNEDVVGKKPEIDDAEALAQWEADLEAARQTVDRIAFAGQVPVNVVGATPGQYIVPVEAADGGIEGIAKDETDMTLAEYMRAVGRVIAIECDGRARIIVKAS